ncbi:MAG: hypothetical protein K8T25_12350 [Planctomycetia bacterium]|nr:hypothetical protein [Planctomycetia bacterium]
MTIHLSTIRIFKLLIAALCCGACGFAATSAVAAETATLKGRFILEGPPPVPAKIVPTANADVCGQHPLESEELVVGKDGGIQNVAVWLFTKGIKGPGAAPEAPAVIENKGCRFAPHMLVMQAGQPLEVKNSDTIAHNTATYPRKNTATNDQIQPGMSQVYKDLKHAETLPFQVSCSVHPWMKGYVVLADTPYAGASSADGSFEIKDLPTDKPLEFQAWQEKIGFVGYKADVTVDGKPTKWNFGRFKMTLKPGENNLGDIKVPLPTN